MHGLPVMEQDVCPLAGGDVGSGNGELAAKAGWGLGGTGPVLKTQTIVSIAGRKCILRRSELAAFYRMACGMGRGKVCACRWQIWSCFGDASGHERRYSMRLNSL